MSLVLVIEDDTAVREALAQTLELLDLEPVTCASFIVAKDHITSDFQGVILSDMRMPGRDGFHVLSYAHQVDPTLPVIFLTGEGDIPMALRAMSMGAYAFLEKPCPGDELHDALKRALKDRELELSLRRSARKNEEGDAAARLIFGISEAAETMRQQVRQVAAIRSDVMVSGPTGAGISKVAEIIHNTANGADSPFVKRAGAGMQRDGLDRGIHAATGGSLFIDDLPAMPADTQLALLEVIEAEHSFRLLAGMGPAGPARATLNPELLFRLEVAQVWVPSLAERPEDIPVLFRQYVAQASEQAGLSPPPVTSAVTAGLMAREWPGNTRALMSEAMRYVLGVHDGSRNTDLGLVDRMAQIEKTLLEQTLRETQGCARSSSELLKLPRKTFYDKLTRHGLRAEDFR